MASDGRRARADAPALLELRRRARCRSPEVGAGEVVLPPLAGEPAVLAALLKNFVLPLAQKLLDGLEAARLEDQAREDGVLACFGGLTLDKELVDDLALRRVGGEQVVTEALQYFMPRLEARSIVLLCGNRPVSPTPTQSQGRV